MKGIRAHQAISIDHQSGSFTIDDRELTINQRKLFNFLLWRFFEDVRDKTVYSISLTYLTHHLNYQGEVEQRLLRACEQLSEIKFHWQLKDENTPVESGLAPLLSQCWIEKERLWYSFSPRLRSFLRNQQIFRLLKLQVTDLLRSSHARKLYDHLLHLTSIETDGWWEINDFITLMGIEGPEARYSAKELARHVIEPSIDEINTVSELAVEVLYRREGSHINGFKFKVVRKYEQTVHQCLRLPGINAAFTDQQQALEKAFETYKASQVCELTQHMPKEDMEDLQKAFLEHIKNNQLLMKKYRKDGFDSLSIKLNFEVFLEKMLLSEEQRDIGNFKKHHDLGRREP
jgi:plasmid replication initiation protein